MENNCRTVLLCHLAIPATWHGSYNVMFTRLLRESDCFDYTISPVNVEAIEDPEQYKTRVISANLIDKKRRTFLGWHKFKMFHEAVFGLLSKHDYLVIYNLDKVELTASLNDFLIRKGLRKRCRIIHAHHHYGLFNYTSGERESLYDAIDEAIFLSYESYHYEKLTTQTLTCEVSVVPNGIPTEYFDSPPLMEIANFPRLRTDSIKFIWVSHGRRKKGFHIIAEAWRSLSAKRENIELIVVGINENEFRLKNAHFVGVNGPQEVGQFLDRSDYLLFSTLFHEGEPLTVIEGWLAKCVVIAASRSLGTDAVIKRLGGKNIFTVDNPNIVDEWVNKIEEVLENKKHLNVEALTDGEIADVGFDRWMNSQIAVVHKWKKRIEDFNNLEGNEIAI